MEAKLLIGRAIGHLVGHLAACHFDDVGVVVLVRRLLADDVFLRHTDGKAHRLTLPLQGVGGRVVGAPAGTQTLLVGKLHRAFHVDDACGETVVVGIAVEKHVDIGIAVAGILRVAQGHIDRLWGGGTDNLRGLPASVNDLDDGAQRPVGDNALGAAAHRFNHRGLLAIPSSESAQTEGVAHPEHIVAIALLLLLVACIELSVFKFQSFLELSVEVERLPLVEVDAYAVQFALEVDAVVVLQIV